MTEYEELKFLALMFAHKGVVLNVPSGMGFVFGKIDDLPVGFHRRVKITFEYIDDENYYEPRPVLDAVTV